MATLQDDQRKKDSFGYDASDDEMRHIVGVDHDEEARMEDSAVHDGSTAEKKELDNLSNTTGDDTLGDGYTDDEEEDLSSVRKKITSRADRAKNFFAGSRKRKAGTIIGIVATGGIVSAVAFLFTSFAALKINTIVENIETRFSASSERAIAGQSDKMLQQWIARDILGQLSKKNCHRYTDPGCITADHSHTIVGMTYNAWRQGHLERKLANDYGIVIGYDHSKNEYHVLMNHNGVEVSSRFGLLDSDIQTLGEGKKIKVDVGGGQTKEMDFWAMVADHQENGHGTKMTVQQLRQLVKDATANETLFMRVWHRWQLGSYLKTKFGIQRCLTDVTNGSSGPICSAKDYIHDKTSDIKLKVKNFALNAINNRIITPLNAEYGLIFKCALLDSGGCDTNNQKTEQEGATDTAGNDASNTIDKTGGALPDLAAETVTPEIAAKIDKLAKSGPLAFFTSELTSKIVSMFVGDAAGTVASDAAIDAIPIIGQIYLIVQLSTGLEHMIDHAGPIIKSMIYATNASAAVKLYNMYDTTASETQSGNTDSVDVNSMSQQLSNGCDATQSKLYQVYNDSGTSTNDSGGNLKSDSCNCNNGQPVPSDKLTCEEDSFTAGSGLAQFIDSLSSAVGAVANQPGVSQVLWVLYQATHILTDVFSWLLTNLHFMDATCSVADAPAHLIGASGPCDLIKSGFKSLGGVMVKEFVKHVVNTMFSGDMTGDKTYEGIAGGGDVQYNQGCQTQLGCKQVPDQQSAQIQESAIDEQKQQFAEQPMFARVFNTSSPYSLVTRMALATPYSTSNMQSNVIVGLVRSPFTALGDIFGSLFPTRNVSASAPASDPFGVPQFAFPDNEIPSDPDEFFQSKCMDDKYGYGHYVPDADPNKAGTFDDDVWVKAQQKDDATGSYVSKTTNPCMLIYQTAISTGTMFDSNMMPAVYQTTSAQNSSQAESIRMASYNMCDEKNHPSCPYANDETTKVSKLVATITGNNSLNSTALDIFSSQETSPDTQASLLKALPNYSSFPAKVARNSGMAVWWNSQKFTAIQCGAVTNVIGNSGENLDGKTDQDCAADYSNDTWPPGMPWAELKDNTTGKIIYVLSIHSPNNSYATIKKYGSTKASAAHPLEDAQVRAADAQAYLAWAKSKETSDNLVLIGGDFNNSSNSDDGKNNSSYCILTSDGSLAHAYDLQNNNTGECPTSGGDSKHIPIDQIYASTAGGTSASDWIRYDANSDAGTDHSPAIATLSSGGTTGTSSSTIKNPLVQDNSGKAESVADPNMISDSNGNYYVFGTGGTIGEWTSSDLKTWTGVGTVVKGAPGGAQWAPDVALVNGKYVMTFTLVSGSNREIVYAVSGTAKGPYQYKGVLINGTSCKPDNAGTIDSSIFVDTDSQAYLTWGGGSICIMKISVDNSGNITKGKETDSPVMNGAHDGSGGAWNTSEGSYLTKYGSYYYLYFSHGDYHENANGTINEYRTMVVRATSPMGPFSATTPAGAHMVLSGDGNDFRGPGGESVFTDAVGAQWLIYHAWHNGKRVSMLDPITYTNGWPVVGNNNGHPSTASQPGPVIAGGVSL